MRGSKLWKQQQKHKEHSGSSRRITEVAVVVEAVAVEVEVVEVAVAVVEEAAEVAVAEEAVAE